MAKDYIEEQIGLIFSSEGISDIIDGLDKIKKKIDNINKGGRGGGRGGGFGNLMTGAAKAASGIKGLNKIAGGFGRTMKGGLGVGVATTLITKFTNAVISSSQFLYKYDKALVSLSVRASSFGASLSVLESSLEKTSKGISLTRMETMELFKEYQRSVRFVSLEQFDKMMKIIQNTTGTNVEAMKELESAIMAIEKIDPVLADIAIRMADATAEQIKNYEKMLSIKLFGEKIDINQYRVLLGMVSANRFLTQYEKQKLEYNKEYLKDIGTIKRTWESIGKFFGGIGKKIVTALVITPKEKEKMAEEEAAEKELWGPISLPTILVKRKKRGRITQRGQYGFEREKPGYREIEKETPEYWKIAEERNIITKEEYNAKKAEKIAEGKLINTKMDLLYRKMINKEVSKTIEIQKTLNIATIEGMAITGQIDYGTINESINKTISLIDSQVASKRALLKELEKNQKVSLKEILSNNEILGTDKEIYFAMQKRGVSHITELENITLQKNLRKDIVSAEKEILKVSLSVLKVREYTTKVVQNEADLASKMVRLADNYAIGIGASMDMRLKEFNQLTKVIQEHEKNLQQVRIRRALDKDNLALKAEELELQKKIMDVTLQQASAVKSMRSGWVEAVAALSTGMGVFTEIIMSAEKGTAQAARLKGIVLTPFSGAYGKGYGYDVSEKFSPYQEFGVGGGRRRGIRGRRWATPYPMLGEGGIIGLERGEIGRVGRRIREQSRRSTERGGAGLSVFGGHRFLGESYFERSRPGAQAIPSKDIERIRAEARKDGYNMARDIQKSYLEGFRVGTMIT